MISDLSDTGSRMSNDEALRNIVRSMIDGAATIVSAEHFQAFKDDLL